jgi:hypothetical protein
MNESRLMIRYQKELHTERNYDNIHPNATGWTQNPQLLHRFSSVAPRFRDLGITIEQVFRVRQIMITVRNETGVAAKIHRSRHRPSSTCHLCPNVISIEHDLTRRKIKII